MNPDESSPGGDLPVPGQPARASSPNPEKARVEQSAAANVIRNQISALYGSETRPAIASAPANDQTDTAVQTNPYVRTHTQHPEPQADQWKQYHSAWQNYYQRYYENYYTHQMTQSAQPAGHYFSSQPAEAQPTAEEVSNDQALYELRQKLLGRVQDSAKKVRHSRHFIPILAAVLVVLTFMFLQYNRLIFSNVAAYVSPGSINPQNIVIDPTNDVIVGQDPRLIIPKINVDVPVLYDVGTDNASQMSAMEKGVAHFPVPGANSHPGEVGNTAIAGHSSNDLFDTGDYKFIFAQLERLAIGDSIYANYQGKRYTYVVTQLEVVKPNEISKLIYPTSKPVITLITCTPLGTALNRLLVTAEQVSPDPAKATAAPSGSGEGSDSSTIPGNSPTLLERLFGAR